MLQWIYALPDYSMNEDQGTVVDVLDGGKEWQIDFQATYWIARSHRPLTLKLGDPVRIIGRCSNALVIEAV